MKQDSKHIAIGVDIGGTHISACRVDLNTNTIITGSHCEEKVDANESASSILSVWSRLIETVMQAGGRETIAGVGIAIPGPFDYKNGISKIRGVGKYENLFGVDVRAYLSAELSLNPEDTHFINDASAFALGEYHMDYCSGYKKILALTLGTGFGSTYIHDGTPLPQMLYNVPYKETMADDYFSTRWFVSTFNARSKITISNVKQLSALADEGDKTALDLFSEFGRELGQFLVDHTSQDMAECVVLGGNICKAWEYFAPKLKKHLSTCKIIKAGRNNNSALTGAAMTTKQ